MDAGKFTLILHLLSTMLLINCAMSYDKRSESQINGTDVTTEWMSKAFVATTPAIKTSLADKSTEEDQSEEEEEGDDDAANHTPIQTSTDAHVRQSNGATNPALMIFNALSSAIFKSAWTAFQTHPPQLSARSASSDDSEYYQEEDDASDGGEVKADTGSSSGRSSSSSNNTSSNEPIIGNDTKAAGVFEGRQAGGSYIKGDPLNGYYDFVITEGSYKFWVVFQLFTAGLLIYSTLAAIYYSKVNPLTSDYDYIDYLSRSFHGRSMDSEDVEDDDDDSPSTTDRTLIESGRTYLSSLAHNKWVRTAAYGFQFAMDAIDRIPK